MAGNGSASYNGTGIEATSASFNKIYGLAADAAGNLFVADVNLLIRMIPATSGTYFGQSMVAGYVYTLVGTRNGGDVTEGALATSSRSGDLRRLTLDGAGNLLFITYYGIRMIPRVSGTYYGKAMTANHVYKLVDQTQVWGFALDGVGKLYFAIYGDDALSNQGTNRGSIKALDRETGVLTKITGWGSQAGGEGSLSSTAGSLFPDALALDGDGNLFFGINGAQLWMIPAASGTYYGKAMIADRLYQIPTSTGYAGEGLPLQGGQTSSGFFQHMAFDPEGNLLFSDGSNHRIRMVPRASGSYYGQAMTADRVYTVAGNGTLDFSGDGGPGDKAQFSIPSQIAIDVNGNVYLSDYANDRVRMIPRTSGTYYGQTMVANHCYTIAGNGTRSNTGDGGPATAATLFMPRGIAAAPDGTIYIVSSSSLRKVDPSGVISTVAVAGGAFASFANLETDALGNLYIADPVGSRVHMLPAVSGTYFGQVMTAGTPYTIAGNGTAGTSLGLATGATMLNPQYLTLDRNGNLYIGFPGGQQVRMLPAQSGTYFGQVMTVGNLYALDAIVPSSANHLVMTGTPMAVDSLGNLHFLVDPGGTNPGKVIRRLSPNNQQTHFAGNGSGGNGSLAKTAAFPGGIYALKFGPDGTLYILESSLNQIRKIS
ncbi:NHL repeat protein [compost metagenome]